MPAHNAEETLAAAVRSVLNQTFRDLELIIVENGSTDATAQTAHDLAAKDPRITAVVDGPTGPAPARNEGIRLARGTWISFLDSDDEYAPEFLETVVAAMETHPGYEGFAVNGRHMGNPIGSITPGVRFRRVCELDLDAVVSMQLITGQVVLCRDTALALGGFDTSVLSAEDKDLWVRYFATHRGLWLPDRLLLYRYDRRSRCHTPERRTLLLESLLNTLALARSFDPPARTLQTIERLERHYRTQLEAFPCRADMERALAEGKFAGARAAYLRSRRAYGKQLNWLLGLPVMMASPRLFTRLFVL